MTAINKVHLLLVYRKLRAINLTHNFKLVCTNLSATKGSSSPRSNITLNIYGQTLLINIIIPRRLHRHTVESSSASHSMWAGSLVM